jgi:hypothetical protein
MELMPSVVGLNNEEMASQTHCYDLGALTTLLRWCVYGALTSADWDNIDSKRFNEKAVMTDASNAQVFQGYVWAEPAVDMSNNKQKWKQ